jgi:hypothetical protein
VSTKSERAEPKAKRKRASKRAVRVWAWSLGALSFLSPLAFLGASPKAEAANPAGSASATTTAAAQPPKRPVVIVVTRRIIKRAAPKPVYTSSSSSGGGGTTYVSAPVSAPAATSCGTHAC